LSELLFPKPGFSGERQARKNRKQRERERFREAVLVVDDFTCQGCGYRGGQHPVTKMVEPIEVHHIIKKSECGANTVENGITLCRPCHACAERGTGDASARRWMAEILKAHMMYRPGFRWGSALRHLNLILEKRGQ